MTQSPALKRRMKEGLKGALQEADTLNARGSVIRKVNAFGLTPKQEEFAMLVALGSPISDAYRQSYDTENMKLSTIYDSASKLMDRPAVAQRIKAILEDRYNRSLIHNVKHVRQHVFDRLMVESMDAKNPPSVRVQAAVWLGRVDIVGMFKEHSDTDKPEARTADDIEKEIKKRLARLLGGQVIDNA